MYDDIPSRGRGDSLWRDGLQGVFPDSFGTAPPPRGLERPTRGVHYFYERRNRLFEKSPSAVSCAEQGILICTPESGGIRLKPLKLCTASARASGSAAATCLHRE
ncbi:hypothetical protein EVAR_63382_1 [Eumeta japonica]|uniref:Uncharacterized protein n=1 Tax=Eumeta variegata TaxID=151549 RepID=A0A4C1YPQ5_EUMVA|nr:hypothetical protein EVAR_63382_1 [Eumeta japonica]